MGCLLLIPLFWGSIKLTYVLWYLGDQPHMSSSCPLVCVQQYGCNMTFNIDPTTRYLVWIQENMILPIIVTHQMHRIGVMHMAHKVKKRTNASMHAYLSKHPVHDIPHQNARETTFHLTLIEALIFETISIFQPKHKEVVCIPYLLKILHWQHMQWMYAKLILAT
jgi:hypothetical protein